MSNGLNKCLFIGNCGKDPETRFTPSGSAVTNISIGVGESWKDKGGNKQERTEWVNVVFYNKLAEIAGEYLRKGSQVFIEGKMQTRKWQDKEGKDRWTTEIVASEMKMLGGRPAPAQDQHNQDKSNGYQRQPEPMIYDPMGGDPFNDDLPFSPIGKEWMA